MYSHTHNTFNQPFYRYVTEPLASAVSGALYSGGKHLWNRFQKDPFSTTYFGHKLYNTLNRYNNPPQPYPHSHFGRGGRTQSFYKKKRFNPRKRKFRRY